MECSAGSDLQRLHAQVTSFLQNKEFMERMSPLDHLVWAQSLPSCLDTVDLPVLLQDSVDRASEVGGADLSRQRLEAKAFWVIMCLVMEASPPPTIPGFQIYYRQLKCISDRNRRPYLAVNDRN